MTWVLFVLLLNGSTVTITAERYDTREGCVEAGSKASLKNPAVMVMCEKDKRA